MRTLAHALLALGLWTWLGGQARADHGLLPDLATLIPQQLQVVNPDAGLGKREVLRFSNGIANIGDGPWRMRPEFPLDDVTQPQRAIQEILDDTGAVAHEAVVSEFEFHPAHNHWHVGGVAEFEVRASLGAAAPGSADIGDILQNAHGAAVSVKTTFCLIDWIRLDGNTSSGSKSDRVYFDCFGDHQGISAGWVDQYHHSTDGQQLDITGAPHGRYYLVSTANAEGAFLESDYTNNSAWVAFDLRRESKGNAKIAIVGDSFSVEGLGIPPSYTANR